MDVKIDLTLMIPNEFIEMGPAGVDTYLATIFDCESDFLALLRGQAFKKIMAELGRGQE